MTSNPKISVPKNWLAHTGIDERKYQELYQRSIEENDQFWSDQANRLSWTKTWSKVKDIRLEQPVSIRWFVDGQLNVCVNCVDRHLPTHSQTVAFHWIPEDPNEAALKITYQTLYENVCRWSALLNELGVKKGDRVTVYLPMIPEVIYAMLACARIGAPHSLVFAGFSPEALADRIKDCQSDFVITADQGYRGGKALDLKANVDAALSKGAGPYRSRGSTYRCQGQLEQSA